MPDGLYDIARPRVPTERELAIIEDSLREFAQLRTWRDTFACQFEEVAELIMPNSRNTFQYGDYQTPGTKNTDRQVDASGMMALGRFSAICDSLLTPKNMTWHGLAASNADLMKIRAVRLYFEQITRILFRLRYAPVANFASQNKSNFMQLGAFGTHGMFIDEFDNSLHPGVRGLRYKSIPMGELFIRENHQGAVDGFIRWFRLSAHQAYGKWGPMGTFPEIMRPALELKSETYYNFIHRVCPRNDYEPGRLDDKGKPYASYYISMEGRCLLQEGGYRMMPAAIARYEQAPGEVYGRSPAMAVLPALKTLNAEKRTFLKQGHRAADPVLLTADDGVVDMSLRPGAINKGGVSQDGRPLVHVLPTGQIQVNKEMMDMERGLIDDSFLVNLFQLALNLKDLPQMTATQVIEIMNQKSILLAPTIGNQEGEYLGAMVEREIDVASQLRLPDWPKMPPELKEAKGEYQVVYSSPLALARRSQEAAGFFRTLEGIKEMVSITQDHSLLDPLDFDAAIPEIAQIQAVPASWMASDEKIAAKRKARADALAKEQEIKAAPAKAGMLSAQANAVKAGIVPPGQAPAEGGAPLAEQLGG